MVGTNNSNCIIVYIEGSVGVGKTTFLEHLVESGTIQKNLNEYKVKFIFEPVQEWIKFCDDSGENVLDKFYKNQEKYGFSFQWYVYMSRTKLIKEALDEGYNLIIVERSIYTDRNVFASALYDSKKMNSMEWKLYKEWFVYMESLCNFPKSKFIYLELSTQESFNRIMKRGRSEEKNIDYNYLDLLNTKHIDWLDKKDSSECYKIKNDYDYLEDKDYINNIFVNICEFIKN